MKHLLGRPSEHSRTQADLEGTSRSRAILHAFPQLKAHPSSVLGDKDPATHFRCRQRAQGNQQMLLGLKGASRCTPPRIPCYSLGMKWPTSPLGQNPLHRHIRLKDYNVHLAQHKKVRLEGVAARPGETLQAGKANQGNCPAQFQLRQCLSSTGDASWIMARHRLGLRTSTSPAGCFPHSCQPSSHLHLNLA